MLALCRLMIIDAEYWCSLIVALLATYPLYCAQFHGKSLLCVRQWLSQKCRCRWTELYFLAGNLSNSVWPMSLRRAFLTLRHTVLLRRPPNKSVLLLTLAAETEAQGFTTVLPIIFIFSAPLPPTITLQ